MNYARATRYALYAAVEMAAAPAGAAVTAAAVAAEHRLPPTVVAKVFQRLVKAGIAKGTRGIAGGYRLARPASELSILDIVAVFESPRATPLRALDGAVGEARGRFAEGRLRQLFEEIDLQTRATFASVSLETLVSPRRPLVLGRSPRARA
jgi:Rrf2 family protein